MSGRDSNPVKSPSETGHDLWFLSERCNDLGYFFWFLSCVTRAPKGKLERQTSSTPICWCPTASRKWTHCKTAPHGSARQGSGTARREGWVANIKSNLILSNTRSWALRCWFTSHPCDCTNTPLPVRSLFFSFHWEDRKWERQAAKVLHTKEPVSAPSYAGSSAF